MCFILNKNKQKALELLKQKINGEIKITYNEISKQSGYSRIRVEVWKDVFDGTVKIYKNNKIYNTKKVPGQRIDMTKKEQKRIDDQKQLEQLLRERDERLKARTNKVSSS